MLFWPGLPLMIVSAGLRVIHLLLRLLAQPLNMTTWQVRLVQEESGNIHQLLEMILPSLPSGCQ
jgi:hypothetical protein